MRYHIDPALIIPCPISTHKRFKNLIGQRFSRLLVVGLLGTFRGTYFWACVCDCGKPSKVAGGNLRTGSVKSCGCLASEVSAATLIALTTTHGMTKTPEYRTWSCMRQRCSNPHWPRWGSYGGRGITVCERWRKFENFYADMGPRPSPKHSIDRYPNNDGNYEPGNCRWATIGEQQRNMRSNRLHTMFGKTQCVAAWADELCVDAKMVQHRIGKGWDIGRALTQPLRRLTPTQSELPL